MAWTPPKTWLYNEQMTYTDMNLYVRDNLEFLYNGIQRVETLTVRNQTAAINLTGTGWHDINSGGLEKISVGEVLAGDQLHIVAGARCNQQWSLGVRIYNGTTLVKQFSGATTSANESMTIPAYWQADTNYADIQVYLSTYAYATPMQVRAATAPEVFGWLSCKHERPPVV